MTNTATAALPRDRSVVPAESGGRPTQPDFFDSPLLGGFRSERSIMIYPFFALQKAQRREPMVFDNGGIRVELHAGKDGIATIYDADLLLYVGSLMADQLARGETPNKTFRFTAHDFLRVAGRWTDGRSYQRIKSIIARLQGTQIRTNIEAGGEGVDGMFSWISEGKIKYKRGRAGEKVMDYVEVTLCDWLHRAILLDRRILKIHDGYFDLSPLERRLYTIARAQVGTQDGWKIGIEQLLTWVGAEMPLRKFKLELTRVGAANALPEYDIKLERDEAAAQAGGGRPDAVKHLVVVFVARSPAVLSASASAQLAASNVDEVVDGVEFSVAPAAQRVAVG